MNISLKKTTMALLCMLMAAMALSGCAANASGTTATAAPISTNTPMAAATMAPAASPAADAGMTGTNDVMNAAGSMSVGNGMDRSGASAGAAASGAAMTPAEAGKLAGQIAEAVERISEIDDAEVVVRDDRVLVAVEFDDQYAAGLDDRMKQMIEDAVQKVDDGLTDISITDDDTLYGQVKGLGERLAKATGFDELADDFGDLWDRITGM